jgi:hypothetical protein
MGKNQDPDPGPGSGMSNPDHISVTFFWVKILKFFDADPGSGIEKIRNQDRGWKKIGYGIWDKHPGSATLLGDAECRRGLVRT